VSSRFSTPLEGEADVVVVVVEFCEMVGVGAGVRTRCLNSSRCALARNMDDVSDSDSNVERGLVLVLLFAPLFSLPVVDVVDDVHESESAYECDEYRGWESSDAEWRQTASMSSGGRYMLPLSLLWFMSLYSCKGFANSLVHLLLLVLERSEKAVGSCNSGRKRWRRWMERG
jgi:hypothetical protein